MTRINSSTTSFCCCLVIFHLRRRRRKRTGPVINSPWNWSGGTWRLNKRRQTELYLTHVRIVAYRVLMMATDWRTHHLSLDSSHLLLIFFAIKPSYPTYWCVLHTFIPWKTVLLLLFSFLKGFFFSVCSAASKKRKKEKVFKRWCVHLFIYSTLLKENHRRMELRFCFLIYLLMTSKSKVKVRLALWIKRLGPSFPVESGSCKHVSVSVFSCV